MMLDLTWWTVEPDTPSHCPKCGAPDVHFVGSHPKQSADVLKVFCWFKCNLCGKAFYESFDVDPNETD